MRWLLLIAASLSLWAQNEVLPMRFGNIAACPAKDAKDSEMLLRVKDPSGLGLEIWCAKENSGFGYQYRLLGSDGRTRLLDRCTIPDGVSSASIDHTGPVATLGQALFTRGRLVRFTQNNWNSQRGRHTVYDFAGQSLSIYETESIEDGLGRWLRVLTSARSLMLDKIQQTEAKLDRPFDSSRISCVTAPSEDGMRILETQVAAFVEPGKAGRLTVAWHETSQISKIEFDAARRQLKLRFPPLARKTVVSIAFPRTMLGLGKELAHVRLDGRFIDSDETTTATHKVIRFRLEEPAQEATMVESGGFPFFMVSGVAIAGGILIGGVVGLLFQRKLPPVADDSDAGNSGV